MQHTCFSLETFMVARGKILDWGFFKYNKIKIYIGFSITSIIPIKTIINDQLQKTKNSIAVLIFLTLVKNVSELLWYIKF